MSCVAACQALGFCRCVQLARGPRVERLTLAGYQDVETIVCIGRDLIPRLQGVAEGFEGFYVIDQRLRKCQPSMVENLVRWARYPVRFVRAGEKLKTVRASFAIMASLDEAGFRRAHALAIVGGGSVLDSAGFAGSIYMRGVRRIYIPTTLLAQLDAAITTKSGVNFGARKNLIGAHRNPEFVVADVRFLATLSGREIRSGLAEAVKVGLAADDGLFEMLERRVTSLLASDLEALEEVVTAAALVKIRLLSEDPLEARAASVLRLGHTFGHAIELVSKPRLSHGEAVAVGLAAATRLSADAGIMTRQDERRVRDLLARLGLPLKPPGSMPEALLAQSVQSVQRTFWNEGTVVVPTAIGSATVLSGIEPEVAARALLSDRSSA